MRMEPKAARLFDLMSKLSACIQVQRENIFCDPFVYNNEEYRELLEIIERAQSELFDKFGKDLDQTKEEKDATFVESFQYDASKEPSDPVPMVTMSEMQTNVRKFLEEHHKEAHNDDEE